MVTDTHGPDLTQTQPVCEAMTLQERVRPGGYGVEAIPCRSRIGLTSFRDRSGMTRRACASKGHLGNCVRRFGVMPEPEPVEPDWEMPESADGLTAWKALR